MGRLKKSDKQIPTLHLRDKAWARDVARRLSISGGGMKPMSHLINSELIEAARKVEKAYVRKALLAELSPGADIQFVSAGRWHDWWSGEAHPSPKKIETINRVLPGSTNWFSTDLEKSFKNKVALLLLAVDIWKSELSTSQQTSALQLLLKIGERWNPVPAKTYKSDGSICVEGWELPAIPDAGVIRYDFIKHCRVLEPSSVTLLMLLSVEYCTCEESKLEWVFDLVASALATKGLLRHHEKDDASILTFGPSADIAALVYALFVSDRVNFLKKEKMFAMRDIGSRIQGSCLEPLPISDGFAETIYQAINRYEHALQRYGIERKDIAELKFVLA